MPTRIGSAICKPFSLTWLKRSKPVEKDPDANHFIELPVIQPEELEEILSRTDKQRRSIAGVIHDAIVNDKIKKYLNYAFNGSAAVVCLAAFVNGNLEIYEPIQENLELVSMFLAKSAFCAAHVIGAVDLWQKKNLIPFLGYASAVPISLLTSGYQLLLFTGISAGFINFIVVIDQRELTDKDNNPILDENGQVQTVGGDFSDKGWWYGIKTSCRESGKMLCELVTHPSKIKKVSNAVLASSLFQIAGSVIGFFGSVTTGAFLRNAGTVCAETSMLLHKDTKNSNSSKPVDFSSPIAQAGLLWNSSAITDQLKRSDVVSSVVSGLTELSLFFDRIASMRFTQGVLRIKNKKKD